MMSTGALLGRWIGSVSHLLTTLGGRGAFFIAAANGFASMLAGLVGFVGSVAAQVALHMSFPWLSRVWPESVVANDISLIEAAVVSILVMVATALGIAVTSRTRLSSRRSSRRTRVAVVQDQAPKHDRILKMVAITLWVMAIFAVLSVKETGMIGVAIAAGALAVAAGITGVLVVKRVIRTAPSDASPRSLAARWTQTSGRMGVTNGLAVTFTLMMTVAVVASGYGYARYRLALSEVPPGVATIRTATGSDGEITIPNTVIKRFVDDVRISTPPIEVYETLRHPTDGDLWGFKSLGDAESVMGSLSSENRSALERGEILLQATPPEDGVFAIVRSDGNLDPVRLPITIYSPRHGHEFQVAGFYLLSALPSGMASHQPSRLAYTKLTSEQDQVAYQWPNTVGLTSVSVSAYRPATGQLVSTLLVISMVGFAAVVLAVVAVALRSEAKALRPVSAGLFAMGVPSSWSRRVLIYLGSWLVGVPLLVSFMVAAVLTSASLIFNPRQFTITAVPWAAIMLSGLLIVVAGLVGVLVASYRIRHGERFKTLA